MLNKSYSSPLDNVILRRYFLMIQINNLWTLEVKNGLETCQRSRLTQGRLSGPKVQNARFENRFRFHR